MLTVLLQQTQKFAQLKNNVKGIDITILSIEPRLGK
jgi:hypothetical protein